MQVVLVYSAKLVPQQLAIRGQLHQLLLLGVEAGLPILVTLPGNRGEFVCGIPHDLLLNILGFAAPMPLG